MSSTSLRRRIDAIHREHDGGFTLIEVVVSFVVFAIVAGAATMAIANGIKISNYTRDRVAAANVAQQDIAKARAVNPSQVSDAGYPITVAAGNHSYTVDRTISYSNGGSCPATRTAGTSYYINLTDVVSWPNDGGRSVRMDTVIAC